MKTKDYVRLFKLDKPFYEFSREKSQKEPQKIVMP